MIDVKGNSGAGRAEGDVDGVTAPAGTWWSTREPMEVSYTFRTAARSTYPSHDESACRRSL